MTNKKINTEFIILGIICFSNFFLFLYSIIMAATASFDAI